VGVGRGKGEGGCRTLGSKVEIKQKGTSTMEQQPFDRAYRDRIASAVIQALIKTVTCEAPDGSRVVVLLPEEITDALVNIQACVLATAPVAKSSRELEHYCEEWSERLLQQIKGTQEHEGLRSLLAEVNWVDQKH
jgi:hypothetical protein